MRTPTARTSIQAASAPSDAGSSRLWPAPTAITMKATSSPSRVRTHSDPERDDGGEDDGGQEVDGELVVARGHAPEVLEATEGSFDPPAIAVASLIVPDRTSARTSAWNDRYCPR